MEQALQITIKNFDNTRTFLFYNLFNNPIVPRWKSMTKQSLELNYEIHSRFTNKSKRDIDYLISEINKVIVVINENYDKQLPVFTDLNELDISILNYLHEEFESYGDRIDEYVSNNQFNQIRHDSFLRLNEWIHIIESAVFHIEHDKFPNYTALYDFLPAGIHETMLETDKLFLETNYKWGGLYCGYNTLGKDWYAVAMDNDLEVVDRDQVRPQRRFAAETWLNFGQDSPRFDIKHEFFKWYETLNEEQKSKTPINNLNEMTFGRLLLGQIIISDELLAFHPNMQDWLHPNHECKKRWNLEVFSKAKEIINVKFV